MKHFLFLAVAFSISGFAQTKVFSGFTLIDGAGGAPVANAAMIVTSGKITWAGAKDQLKTPAGAEAVDLTGKFVMPGIINLHGHLGNTKGMVQDPNNFTRENLEANLRTYAAYGVTSVLSMGADQPRISCTRRMSTPYSCPSTMNVSSCSLAAAPRAPAGALFSTRSDIRLLP